ncbi:MAG: hypothetical protein M1814_001644 [Vezdaea aestivalis]|nr:MAG: hypothetical protein M1814_001644 [Vezdaea aestivalis]
MPSDPSEVDEDEEDTAELDEDYEEDYGQALRPIDPLEDQIQTSMFQFRPSLQPLRTTSGPPSLVQSQSRTPSTEGSFGLTAVSGSHLRSLGPKRWSVIDLPEPGRRAESAGWGKSGWSKYSPEVQFYLHYHETHMTHHYYSLKTNCDTFLKTTFLDIAVTNEALLFAVVGFAAYHHTLTKPDGQIHDFLKFYNKSVSLLLESLRTKRNSEATLLTILQLATTEEYLGHWVNLRNHQDAAHKILTQLYTPETIMNTEISRLILAWYARFDVFTGLLSGHQGTLSRVWFEASLQHYLRRVAIDPIDLIARIECMSSEIRLFALDLAELIDKAPHVAPQTFLHENAMLAHRIARWGAELDVTLRDEAWFVHIPGVRTENDVLDPFEPGLLMGGERWPVNTLLNDWYAIDSMQRFQTAKVMGKEAPPELRTLAFKMCQMFEAIDRWEGSPKGSLVASQASLSLSCLFLPREKHWDDWARRKLVIVERNGYIYPPPFRANMAQLWSDPSVLHSWTPNPSLAEVPPIIRAIRTFVEERLLDDDNTGSGSSEDALGGGQMIAFNVDPHSATVADGGLYPLQEAFAGGEMAVATTGPAGQSEVVGGPGKKRKKKKYGWNDPESVARESDLRDMKSIFSAMRIEPSAPGYGGG